MSPITKIKKRNGEIVDFDANKILMALTRSFESVNSTVDIKEVKKISDAIIEELNKETNSETYSVEQVQDLAEKALMENGHYTVAKAYIVYRHEHQKQRTKRKEEVVKKVEDSTLYVTKRNGTRELISNDKLKRTIAYYIQGYESIINIDAIAKQVESELYEDIPTEEITRTIIMVLRSFIEHDPAYSYAAARALIVENYKTVIGVETIDFNNLNQQIKDTFKKNIRQGVLLGKLDPKMLVFDMERLSEALHIENDFKHSYLSVQTLTDRYFLRENFKEDPLETLQAFWMRVAMGLAINETDRDEWAIKFYNEMSYLRYVPSTPTLFHSGTCHPQLSSCYLTTVEDSLSHIFKSIGDNAQLSKWSGGIGNDWTNLRGTGALIKGTGVSSQGVIPFLKIANDTTAAINRSGRRRGAACAYLETWHWDIEDFLELRKNTGDERRRTHDMNTSNWIPDLFMKRVKENGEWSLFSPDETPELHHIYGKEFEEKYIEYEKKGEAGELALYKKVKALDLWKKMLTMLFETGHPWITFKDPCNVRSPQDHAGVVHSSNLCTEITLNSSADETAVCNLGSINLGLFIQEKQLDVDALSSTVSIAMRMLDNVVDINFYPTIEAKNSNMKHRPIGLGLRGVQDALYKMDISFESDAAVEFADFSMEVISYNAILTSSQLAKERGAYESFLGSKWDRGLLPIDTIDLLEQERGIKIPVERNSSLDWAPVRESIKKYGMRNSNCMAIAPTATTANISDCFPTIEPIYKNIFVKSNQAGDFTVVNPYLIEDLKKLNLWDAEMLGKLKYNDGNISKIAEIPETIRAKYKEVFEIDPRWLIKATAYRGKWVDQSQSFNVFYAGASGKEINDIYMYAWEMGLKTTYYLRTLGVSQVEKSTVSTNKFGSTHKRAEVTTTSTAPRITPEQTPSVASPTQKQTVGVVTSSAAPSTLPISPKPTDNTIPTNGEGIPLCRIEDPECESCGG